MKKIEISNKQIDEIIIDYKNHKISSNNISLKYNIPKKRVLNILKENNIEIRNSGRIDLGGKKEADKRYYSNPIIKERKKIISKDWYTENKVWRKEYMKKYREDNIENIRTIKRIYEKTRKSNDPLYRLIGNFRTAIYTVLKENNVNKYGHYFDILGYTQEDLINHLDKQLQNGMTWENYGKWHVDHKIPITSFIFTSVNDIEFKKCWSLDNLQPMWGPENIVKSNKNPL
jgi:hypothetical protein